MPPSGYSIKQSSSVGDFLNSCAEALLEEAHQNRMSLPRALESELANIRRYLEQTETTAAQAAILRLTETFYQAVRDRNPNTQAAFFDAVKAATGSIESEILAIKVPSVV